MTPTNELRFVKRTITEGPVGGVVRILQQKWAVYGEETGREMHAEWRDVTEVTE